MEWWLIPMRKRPIPWECDSSPWENDSSPSERNSISLDWHISIDLFRMEWWLIPIRKQFEIHFCLKVGQFIWKWVVAFYPIKSNSVSWWLTHSFEQDVFRMEWWIIPNRKQWDSFRMEWWFLPLEKNENLIPITASSGFLKERSGGTFQPENN